MRSIHEILNNQYYKKSSWILILLPLSYIYFLIIFLRSWSYKSGIFKTIKINVPVIIVGNINIGGTGKTPLVIWLLEKLIKFGMKPGLICRGYNSNASKSIEVLKNSKVENVGDEALMIKLRLDIPIFSGKKRGQVARSLLMTYPDVDVVISDDGLQHFELFRDFEIVVVDGVRLFGNGHLIPAGPLRETVTRVKKVDAVVINSQVKKEILPLFENTNNLYEMAYSGDVLQNCVHTNQIFDLSRIDKEIIAVTGIGNPERFFTQLTNAGVNFKRRIFNDHHMFTESDFKDYDGMEIVMTEKDAVKCKIFAKENFWFLPVSADVEEKLFTKIIKKIRTN